MLKRILFSLFILILSSTLFAQAELITFHVKPKATLFWFYNKSNQPILLNHPFKKNPGAQAGWASVIDPGHWSIISLSQASAYGKKVFHFNCSTWSSGQVRIKLLSCQHMIATGIVEGTRLPANFQSGFWFAENKSLLGLRKQFHYWKVPYPYLYLLYLKIKAI